MDPFVLIAIFVISTAVGYKLIKNIPTLLHTPLMSGMNALSGVTVVGALAIVGLNNSWIGYALGLMAIILAMLNVVSGFAVTHRMLKMFKRRD